MMTRIFRIREATIVNGTVVLIDEGRPDGPRTVTLQSVEAALEIYLERGQADLHVSPRTTAPRATPLCRSPAPSKG